ncbi:nuclease-related domain-containing protein [uncultured Thiodictyon sp.]|uniref:nuclease-related domain-containing protein n=1 Tax=uncultured Thiodictyon sp. TaxID=1846217 RepID=UPI0025E366E8|nr:nuclease-related domain-containing protein [uncultured Thiodictyon sp.]
MSNVDPMAAMVEPLKQVATTWVLWMVVLTVALVAFKSLLLPGLRGRLGERQVGAVLDRLGTETLHDVILPDDHGGLTQIDHLVLTGAGLPVVETKHYRGSMFGQEREPQWTQRLGRRSVTFQNPLRQNYAHTQAVKALVPGVPVFGRVVFTDDARFPKGMPDGVSSLRDLRRDLREVLGDAPPSPALLAVWERLKGRVDRSKGARQAHLDGIRARHGAGPATPLPWRRLLPLVPALAAVLWVWFLPKSAVPTIRARPTAAVPAPPPVAPPPKPPVAAKPPTAPNLEWSTPAAHTPAVASPSPTPPPVAPVSRPPAASKPATAPHLEWYDPAARTPAGTQSACNMAVAALLTDNSDENRMARDRACAAGKADAVPARSLPRR